MAARRAARGAALYVTVRLADIEVESIAAGGDGVARCEGLVVFVPRAAPGDRARARVEQRGRLARGEIVSLVAPSADRIEPPCPHYTRDRCGGCQIQHLRYGAQLDAKRGIVRDSLQRIARRDVDVPPVVASDREWRYRRKLTLALRRRGPRWIAGLHPYDAPGRVFELGDCPITDQRVVDAWRSIMQAAALLPDGVTELRGAVRLLDDGVSFVLEGGRRWATWREFVAAAPVVSSLWWEREGGDRRLLHDARDTRTPAASFVQVNAGVAAALWDHALERVEARTPSSVVDAYAGAGDAATRLARRGVRVTAIEADREEAAWCAERLAGAGMAAGSRSIAARVEDVLADALPADVAIVNPPRTGLHERAAAVLQASSTAALVYVSCNPATLARDLGRLPAYRVASLRSFDMFPQTAHVETVCELVREAA
jgi:23S rRNA (uracil1939-C5)-methyltransferase